MNRGSVRTMRDPDKPQQIIDAAVRVFARYGFYNSRVSDIAREAGIASGTIYLYFKTKDEILVTLFREKMAGFVSALRKEIAGEPEAPAKPTQPSPWPTSFSKESPAMGFETLVLAREESFAIVTLNRPPANAISEPLIRELNDALNAVREDDSVRSVVITGAGDKIFCGGADLGSAFSGGDVEAFIRFGNSVMRKIERFPKPVIAAINGHAMGGGMEIAMACHFRLMKETARMGQTESNLGIIPGYGGSQRLPR